MDATTAASLATAAGTLVLAVATFASVRSSNRSARLAEYSMQLGIRPLLMPSRLDDAPQKIRWGDDHRASLLGSGAHVEIVDGNIYLAMSVRNAGSGIAVLHGWHLRLESLLIECSFHFSHIDDFGDGGVQSRDNFSRRVCGRQNPVPAVAVISRHAGFVERRGIRHHRDALLARHRQRPDLVGV